MRREEEGETGVVGRLGFIGHLLACGLQIYRCWAEEESDGGRKEGSTVQQGTQKSADFNRASI